MGELQNPLPCPFCGGDAVVEETKSPELVVRCSECSAAAFASDWKRRVTESFCNERGEL